MEPSPLSELRKLCLSLPEAREVAAWGAPTFRVKTIFAMYSAPDGPHGDGRESAWIKAHPTDQDFHVRDDPERFFIPPYVGPKGWIGVYIDHPETDWDHIEQLLRDAWRLSVPKRLLAAHDGEPSNG